MSKLGELQKPPHFRSPEEAPAFIGFEHRRSWNGGQKEDRSQSGEWRLVDAGFGFLFPTQFPAIRMRSLFVVQEAG
jgi:hypothetical protein